MHKHDHFLEEIPTPILYVCILFHTQRPRLLLGAQMAVTSQHQVTDGADHTKAEVCHEGAAIRGLVGSWYGNPAERDEKTARWWSKGFHVKGSQLP